MAVVASAGSPDAGKAAGDTDPLFEVVLDGIPIASITFDAAVALIARWAIDGTGGYVSTPNVDHVVQARRNPTFRTALLGARLRVPDGMGVIYGSRLAGRPLAGTVTGRLLPAAVGNALRGQRRSIALFGGPPGVAEAAAMSLRAQGIDVSDAFGPSMGFRLDTDEDAAAVERLRAVDSAVVFIGLGAPKQEIWMARHAADLPGAVLVGVGAALDVLAGRFTAAPAWMTRVGLEWAYRLGHEPRRLARRYLLDDPRFFVWMIQARVRRPG